MNLIQKDFAALLGVSTQLIWKVRKADRVVLGADGKYDLDDPINRAYIREHFHREFLNALDDADEDEVGLETEKTREEIRYLQARALKVELQNAELKRDLVPFKIVREGWGAFANALRNNILTIGNRIGRGDTKLRDRVEKAVKRAIEKSIKQTRAEIERITNLTVEVDDE